MGQRVDLAIENSLSEEIPWFALCYVFGVIRTRELAGVGTLRVRAGT